MGLFDSLRIGASGIMAQQAALQVTGNNMANSATPGYARQMPMLSATGTTTVGNRQLTGAGVQLTDVRRMVDQAIEGRLRDAQSQVAQFEVAHQSLARIEALMNEMTDTDLSSALTALFNSFSALAQSPQDHALRGVVQQRAATVADRFQYIRNGLEEVRSDLTAQLASSVQEADRLAGAIADLNVKIVSAEAGGATAASLRDQRDAMLSQLSQLVAIHTNEDPAGAVQVFLGSEPLVYGGTSRGLQLTSREVDGALQQVVAFADNEGRATLEGGRIAGLQATRDGEVAGIIGHVDRLAGELIWQVNRLHSAGTALTGQQLVEAANAVTDPAVALDSAAAGLSYTPGHGSFLVTVTDTVTGATTQKQINVNLDGTPGGTTLNDIVGQISSMGGVMAFIDSAGRLTVQAGGSDQQVDFAEDSSGVLAALGMNSFFAGYDATTIRLADAVAADGGRIAAGRSGNAGDGTNAAALARLASAPVAGLNGLSLPQFHQRLTADVAVLTASAADAASAQAVVQQSLAAQREAVSGVSMDEEAVNLIRFQRAFQGSARFLSVVNELLETLLSIA